MYYLTSNYPACESSYDIKKIMQGKNLLSALCKCWAIKTLWYFYSRNCSIRHYTFIKFLRSGLPAGPQLAHKWSYVVVLQFSWIQLNRQNFMKRLKLWKHDLCNIWFLFVDVIVHLLIIRLLAILLPWWLKSLSYI